MTTQTTDDTLEDWRQAAEAEAALRRIEHAKVVRLRDAYHDLARYVVADYNGVEGHVSESTVHSARRALEDEEPAE